MLRWCQEAGIEMATVYLLSTEKLQRDTEELSSLIEIITDVVEEICAPANRWSVRTVGDLELLGQEPARRLRDAVESTNGARRDIHVNVAVGYGGRQEIVDAGGRCSARRSPTVRGRAADRGRHRRRDLGEPVHLGQPDPIWSSARRGSSAVRLPAVAERVLGDVVHGGLVAQVPAGGLPARAAGLHRAAPPLRRSLAERRRLPHSSHGCAVGAGVLAQLVVGPLPVGP